MCATNHDFFVRNRIAPKRPDMAAADAADDSASWRDSKRWRFGLGDGNGSEDPGQDPDGGMNVQS